MKITEISAKKREYRIGAKPVLLSDVCYRIVAGVTVKLVVKLTGYSTRSVVDVASGPLVC